MNVVSSFNPMAEAVIVGALRYFFGFNTAILFSFLAFNSLGLDALYCLGPSWRRPDCQ
jgi:hypothetical protein